MIGSDLLITAGHCVAGKDLSKYRWVFGFRYSNASSVVVKIPKADVKIATLWKIPSDYAPTTRSDWAALKLATPVGVWFMPRRSQEKIANHWPVYMYGYPNGLPYKLANDAMVLENSDPYLFRTSLDAFQGNSGSPVLSDRLHIVEGILVGGEDDYVQEGTCYKVKTCPLNGEGCRKELVVRIAPVVAALGK
jgi:V8-like Glu-specific endopeptidase